MKKTISLLLVILFSGVSLSAGAKGEATSAVNDVPAELKKVSVFTSILPQRYFVERIGGERVEISVMVKPGQSPETYEPTPDQVIRLGKADVFFTIGVPFEIQFVPSIKKTIRDLLIADTSQGIEKRLMTAHDHDEGEDDEKHSHEESSLDPHVWLSPVAVKTQAVNIFNTLSEIDPAGREYYKDNLDRFIKDLDDIHTQLKEILSPYRGKTIFVYHPAFGYFTDQYGLIQEAIETGGKDPAPATLMEIIERAKEEDVKIIFVQPEFPKKSAEAVAKAINGSVIELNPLNPDYLNNLKYLASEISRALEK